MLAKSMWCCTNPNTYFWIPINAANKIVYMYNSDNDIWFKFYVKAPQNDVTNNDILCTYITYDRA